MATTQTTPINLALSATQARDTLRALQQQADELRRKMQAAVNAGDPTRARSLQNELNRTNQLIRRMQTESANAARVLRNLDSATPQQLQKTLQTLNRQIRNVSRGTAEFDRLAGQIRQVRAAIAQTNSEMQAQPGLWQRIRQAGVGAYAAIAGAMAAASGAKSFMDESVRRYSEVQEEMAGVTKYSGLTADEVARLNEAFKNMDTRTSREELNKLAQDAGRLGKSSVEDILGFVSAADKINVALDDLGEGATLTLSKLTNLYGLEEQYGTETALLKTGSVINELSQNCSAGAGYIAEFTTRMAASGKQAGLSIPQIMAYAAVMDEAGVNVEQASTAISKLVVKLFQEPAKYAQAAGLEVNKWLQTLKSDTNEGFLQFIQGLSEKGGLDALAPLFKDMGESGIGAMNALGLLAGRIDTVRAQQEAANDAFEKGVSITNEAAVANSTVAAGLEKSRKELDEVKIAVGERLMPVMTAANETATVSMRVIGWLVSVMMENRVALISLLATYALYSAAVNLAAIRTAALTLAQQAAAAASGAARVAGLALSSVMALMTGNVTRAAAAWRMLTTTIKTTSGVAGIVVAVIGAVVAATASWISRVNAAAEAQRRHNETLRSYANQIRDVDREGTIAARKEVNRLKEIYDAATDEARSKRDRIAAAQELLRLYPSQFSRFTTEQIMLGNARKAYDDLTTSIINNAKARAAAEKVLENERKILDIEQEIEKKKDARADAQATLDQKEAANRARDSRAAESAKSFAGSIAMAGGSTAHVDRVDTSGDRAKIKEIDTEIKRSNEEVAELNKSTQKLTERFKSNEEFRKAYNAGDTPTAPATPEITYTPSSGGSSSSGGSGKGSSTKSDSKKRAAEFRAGLDAIEKEWKEADAMTIGLYKTGSITLSEYQKRLHDSESQMFDAKIEYYRQAGLEQDEDVADFRRKKEQSDLEYLRKYRKSSATEIKREQSQAELQAQIDYVTPGSDLYRDEEALQERLFRLKVYYLYRTRALYEENSEEYASLTEQVETAEQEERLRKEKATAELMLQYSEEYQLQESKRREEIEISTLDALHERGRLSEEEYQKALKEIREKYEKERANGGDSSGSSNTTAGFTASSEWGSMVVGLYDAFTMQLDASEDAATAWAKKISAIAQAAFAVVSSVSQQLAAYQSAVIDAESAKVSAAYDRRIKAASRNAKLQQRLEEQKEKALAKIKADATRRSFAMQVATAIAQTALNAILAATAAYQVGGMAGLILAPIAAAMAIAAGAVQIATINKQKEAALAGYSEGGFTSPGDVDEVAGVVHAGEWVASQKLVNNPTTRPMIDYLEYAQRHNTFPSINHADVSRTITAPTLAAMRAGSPTEQPAPVVQVTPPTDNRLQGVIDRLTGVLESGIRADVSIAGRLGIDEQQRRYDQLIKNKKLK